MAKQNDVMGKGQFRGDIPSAIADEAGTLLSKIKDPKKWNPFVQDNILFAVNKKVGGAIEDNAKLAHFMSKMIDDGMDAQSAAQSVKKFLFDYGDLTWTEKNIFKRVAPFYTWTRKNIPLQIEQMIAQPAKYALIPKVIQMIESNVPNPNTEKYMSKYLTENLPVRYKKNDKGEYEYFMLGNWLPAAQAVDFLSQPLDNIIGMVTPLVKTPFESGIPLLRDLSPYLEGTNMSLYFKDTLGGLSKIENQPGDLSEWSFGPADWMKVTMRRKDINFMRNIRVLNEIHNLTKEPAKDDPATSNWAKVLNTILGKAGTYNVQKSKFFYDRDTERKIQEYENQIKDAQKLGNYEKVKDLRKETFDFKKLRKKQ
jgi:hypothetical protein